MRRAPVTRQAEARANDTPTRAELRAAASSAGSAKSVACAGGPSWAGDVANGARECSLRRPQGQDPRGTF